jgi:hypothetical protein
MLYIKLNNNTINFLREFYILYLLIMSMKIIMTYIKNFIMDELKIFSK